MAKRGIFITFEGIDGSGKTTQMRLLAQKLRAMGRDVLETVEPGGTEIGTQIRRILLNPANRDLTPTAELLLYFASRAQNVQAVLCPALAEGRIVLCDRFTDSTLAYQGFGRGLSAELILELDRIACGGLKPDRTVFIDIDVETSLRRAHRRNLKTSASDTRMDEQPIEFHARVRDGYLALAKRESGRILTINGCANIDDVAAQIWEAIAPHV